MGRKDSYLGVFLEDKLKRELAELADSEFQGNQSHCVRTLIWEALNARRGMAPDRAKRRRI